MKQNNAISILENPISNIFSKDDQTKQKMRYFPFSLLELYRAPYRAAIEFDRGTRARTTHHAPKHGDVVSVRKTNQREVCWLVLPFYACLHLTGMQNRLRNFFNSCYAKRELRLAFGYDVAIKSCWRNANPNVVECFKTCGGV